MIREINNEAAKLLKRNTVLSGTLETDQISDILSRGIKRKDTGKIKQLRLQLGTEDISRSFFRTYQKLGEQGKSREVNMCPQQLEMANLCYVRRVQYFFLFPKHPFFLTS